MASIKNGFWSEVCVAANGALRFSCAVPFGLHTFYFKEENKMKKLVPLLLIAVIMLSFAACASKNVETFSNGFNLHWNGASASRIKDVSYYAAFKNGVLTIEKWEPKDPQSASSQWKMVDSKTYKYELQGNNTIIIEGVKTYTYKIEGKEVVFNENLLGIDSRWKKTV